MGSCSFFLKMILSFCFVWEARAGVFYNPLSYLWKCGCCIPFLLPSSYCSKDVYNKENLFNSLNYDVAAKKRKKDILNSKTKTQCKPFVLHIRRKGVWGLSSGGRVPAWDAQSPGFSPLVLHN